MRVVTLAGVPVQKGCIDGRGDVALFNSPYGITLDEEGNLFTTDCYNSTVRKISIEGEVTTIAGYPGRAGFVDGEAIASLFGFPTGIVRDKKGNLFVCDNSSCTIRKISPEGKVSTFAGVPGKKGEIDGPGRVALLNGPQGITIDSTGTLYITENRGLKGAAVRKISPEGIVNTLLPVKEPYSFQGITVDGKGFLVFTDNYNHVIWRMPVTGGKLTRLAGGVQNPGYTDGGGISSRFNEPRDLTIDHYGNIYVTDMTNHLIRKISADGYVSTVAGIVQGGCADGTTTGSLGIGKFYTPIGITTDWSGIYVADHGNCTIRKIFIPFEWSPEKHNWLPRRVRQQLTTVMILALKHPETGEPRYPQAHFHLLARDLLYVIFVFIAAVNF